MLRYHRRHYFVPCQSWAFVCLVIPFLVFRCGRADSQGGKTLICPDDGFFDGDSIDLQCKVSETAVTNAGCLFSPPSVDFQLVDTSSVVLLATSAYPDCNTNYTGDARCVSKIAAEYTYAMKFLADKSTQDEKSLRCWMTCIKSGGQPSPPPFTVNDSVCLLQFTDPIICLEKEGIAAICVGACLLVIIAVVHSVRFIKDNCASNTFSKVQKIGIFACVAGSVLIIIGGIMIFTEKCHKPVGNFSGVQIGGIVLAVFGSLAIIFGVIPEVYVKTCDRGNNTDTRITAPNVPEDDKGADPGGKHGVSARK